MSVHLRELDIERIEGIVADPDDSVLVQEVGHGNAVPKSKFLCQNRLRKVCISVVQDLAPAIFGNVWELRCHEKVSLAKAVNRTSKLVPGQPRKGSSDIFQSS